MTFGFVNIGFTQKLTEREKFRAVSELRKDFYTLPVKWIYALFAEQSDSNVILDPDHTDLYNIFTLYLPTGKSPYVDFSGISLDYDEKTKFFMLKIKKMLLAIPLETIIQQMQKILKNSQEDIKQEGINSGCKYAGLEYKYARLYFNKQIQSLGIIFFKDSKEEIIKKFNQKVPEYVNMLNTMDESFNSYTKLIECTKDKIIYPIINTKKHK